MVNGIKLFALSVVAATLALPSLVQAVVVKDDRHIEVTIQEVPKRIVSLLPSLTETVCALDQCQKLVGVDRYSNWPESLQSLPKLGGGIDPNIESVVALKPDLVLMAASARGADRLRALGLKVLVLEPSSHADVLRVMRTIALALDVPQTKANLVWQTIDASVTQIAQSLPKEVRGKRIYFEVSPVPYGAGETSFIGETLSRLGMKNILPASMGSFPKVNSEWVVRQQPDVIMMSEGSAVAMSDRPGWGALNAIRRQNICVFTPQEGDVLVRPGPRMAEAAQLMAKCLRSKQ